MGAYVLDVTPFKLTVADGPIEAVAAKNTKLFVKG